MTEQERLEQLMFHYQEVLHLLGEDPQREGLLKTPERVAKAMLTLTRGYDMDPIAVLNSAKFVEDYKQMVIVKDIREALDPLGVMVVVEGEHMCMQMRGVEKQHSLTTTSSFCGAFEQAKTREEFLQLIHRS